MNNICFLLPCHPPHYGFVRDFKKSFDHHNYGKQADICLVFTNEEEKEAFGDCDKFLILPEDLRIFENRGIINIKKLWALKQLQTSQYQYIIVIDAETLLIKDVDLNKICQNYFEQKILWGNTLNESGIIRTQRIKESCKRFFNPNALLDSELYLWFNQPCIYKTSTLEDFFSVTQIDKSFSALKWEDFDYYIYMYYLILYHNFTICDLEIISNYGVAEATIELIRFQSDKYKQAQLYMCSKRTLEKFDNPYLFMLIHLDRDLFWVIDNINVKISHLSQRVHKIEQKLIKKSKKSKFYKFIHLYWLRGKK